MRRSVAAASTVALAPVVILASRALRDSWAATGDYSLIELRTRAVGTSHTPLVGPYSRFGWNHPGPTLFFALAAPYRLLASHGRGLLLGAALIAGVATVAIVVGLMRADRPPVVGVFGLLVFAALVRALGAGFLWDPWNPYVIVLPFFALVLASWWTASGDERALPFAVGFASFVVQTHADPINEMIMEQLVMIDAVKRASAKRITAVIPYYGYSRQDHKVLAREPISARLMADLIQVAGADRVISVDLHSGQIQGFFDRPFDHLTAMPLLTDYIAENFGPAEDLVVVSPDAGRIKSAQRLRTSLHSDLAFIYKRRSRMEAHKIEQVVVVGDVAGRRCVLIDDMIDTAGTIVEGAKALAAEGASAIYAAATHPVLSGKAVQMIAESPIKEIVVTNTLPIPEEKVQVLGDRLNVLSIAPIVASALDAVFEDESVSGIFQGENQP